MKKFPIICIIFFIAFSIFSIQGYAWWNESVFYKQPVEIHNPDNSAIDYMTVNISLNTSALIEAEKMQPDCDDIWVINDTAETEYDFGIICNQTVNGNATITLKLNMSALGYENVTLYYGAPDATAHNKSWREVHYLFYDFGDDTYANTTKWQITNSRGDPYGYCSWNNTQGRIDLNYSNGTYWGGCKLLSNDKNLSLHGFRIKLDSFIEKPDLYWGATWFGWTNSTDWYDENPDDHLRMLVSENGHDRHAIINKSYDDSWLETVLWSGTRAEGWHNFEIQVNETHVRYLVDSSEQLAWKKYDFVDPVEMGYAKIGAQWRNFENRVSLDNVTVYQYPSTDPPLTYFPEQTAGAGNPTSIELWLNNSESDISFSYGSALNSTARINVTGLWVAIEKNGTLISNGTTTTTDITVWEAGIHKIRAYYNGNGTYKSSEKIYYANISKASTTLHLALNNQENNVSVYYDLYSTTNATAWKNVNNGNISLFRDGNMVNTSNTLNSISEIKTLGVGLYNYTVSLDHENYTANPVTWWLTIEKTDSMLEMTADPSWTIVEGTQVNVSCTALGGPLNTTLYKDGINVSNPYVAILEYGNYNFTCIISDMGNYTPNKTTQYLNVLSGGYGCSNWSTYAFSKMLPLNPEIVNINFTYLIDNNYVKPDFSDVWVNTSGNVWYNGTFMIIDNSGGMGNYYFKFGNYIANQTYEVGEFNGTGNMTMSQYNEINPYYVLTFIDEVNGSQSLPKNSTKTVTLLCNAGSSSFRLDNDSTKILVSTFIKVDEIKTEVKYSATEYYYRNLIIDSPVEFRNIFLVDAEQYQVVEMLITLEDFTGIYKYGYLSLKKYLEGTLETITENQFDIEDKVIVYLINGDKYSLYLKNQGRTSLRNVGFLEVDSIDLTKTLVVGDFPDVENKIGQIRYNLTFDGDDDTIRFYYIDPSNQTINTSFWVYNYTNSTQLLYFASSDNESWVNFNYIVPDNTSKYKAEFEIAHLFFGTNSYGGGSILQDPSLSFLIFPIAISSSILTGIAIITILSVGLLFGSMYGASAGTFTGIFAGLLVYWGFWYISPIVIGLAILLSILNKMKERRP